MEIAKAKVKMHYNAKKRSINIIALKMIIIQAVDEKLKLENWKTDLLNRLTNEIAQIYKVNNIAIEPHCQEI